jgi:hypothetical protein
MKEIILAIILVVQVFAFCHIGYQIYKRKIRFDAQYIWVLIVTMLPIVGPMIYALSAFTAKNSDNYF